MKKLYISMPVDERFSAIERMYSTAGYTVINPYRSCVPVADSMKSRLKLLLTCDAILILPHHKHNQHAENELIVAQIAGINMLYYYDTDEYVQPFITLITQINWEKLVSASRNRNLVDIRRVIAYILRHYYRLSLNSIGRVLNRDHSSIAHLIKSHKNLIETDDEYRKLYHTLAHVIIKEKGYEQ